MDQVGHRLQAQVENARHVGVADPRRRLALAAKALQQLGLLEGCVRQDLEGHHPSQANVVRPIDLSVASAPQKVEDSARSQDLFVQRSPPTASLTTPDGSVQRVGGILRLVLEHERADGLGLTVDALAVDLASRDPELEAAALALGDVRPGGRRAPHRSQALGAFAQRLWATSE